MLNKEIITKIIGSNSYKLIDIGTGINPAYKILTKNQNYFIKYSKTDNLADEAYELEMLGKYAKTPKIVAKSNDYLILEWIETLYNPNSSKQLAENLANLHNKRYGYFGFEFDNKIGTTKQINTKSDNWAKFYWQNRILYQIDLAKNNNLINAKEYKELFNLREIIQPALNINIKPVLLHGDLWSGNYLTGRDNVYFIDSASYYGHSETDLSLSYIFGGFTDNFYQHYFKIMPKMDGFELRRYIYMLYHYLNHLNIFGKMYHSSVFNCVSNIINYD